MASGVARVRKHRPDDASFAVAEFIAHDSWLRFRSLNHGRGDDINSKPAFPKLDANRTCQGHGETDAFDPKQTLAESRPKRAGSR